MKEDTQQAQKVPITALDMRERVTAEIEKSIAAHEAEYPCSHHEFWSGMQETLLIIRSVNIPAGAPDPTQREDVLDVLRRRVRETGGSWRIDDVQGFLGGFMRRPDAKTARALLDRLTADGALVRINSRGRVMWHVAQNGGAL